MCNVIDIEIHGVPVSNDVASKVAMVVRRNMLNSCHAKGHNWFHFYATAHTVRSVCIRCGEETHKGG